jgi:hypothetical protein
MYVDDLARIAEATRRLGPSDVRPPETVGQALFDVVASERALTERRERTSRNWAGFALAASVLLVAAAGVSRPAATPASARSWQVLQSGVTGVHKRLIAGDSNTANRLGAVSVRGKRWIVAAMAQAGMAGVNPPEFSLASAGWKAQAAVPLTGGGLAIHMGRQGSTITAAMMPAGPDALPPGGTRTEVAGQTPRSFKNEGHAWVFWHEGAVLCVVISRGTAPDLVRVVSAGFRAS